MEKLDGIFVDLDKANREIQANHAGNSGLSMYTLEAFEDISHLMAKHADSSIPDTEEEWLEGFNVLSICLVPEQIIERWNLSEQI